MPLGTKRPPRSRLIVRSRTAASRRGSSFLDRRAMTFIRILRRAYPPPDCGSKKHPLATRVAGLVGHRAARAGQAAEGAPAVAIRVAVLRAAIWTSGGAQDAPSTRGFAGCGA